MIVSKILEKLWINIKLYADVIQSRHSMVKYYQRAVARPKKRSEKENNREKGG